MMKFQHLILPLVLWLSIGLIMAYVPPESPLVIGGVLILFSLVLYLSVRLFSHKNIPVIVTCCMMVFLLSNILSGFNYLNLLLIIAIGILVSQLIT